MIDLEPSDANRAGDSADPLEALYLLPSAPHELVVEVYWHLAGRLREAATSERAAAAAELQALNEAYAAALRSRAAAGASPGTPAPPTAGAHRSWILTGWRRPAERRVGAAVVRAQTPWDLLCVRPGAPSDVAELAYRFWKERFRLSDADTLEKLDSALKDLPRDGTGAEAGDVEDAAEDLGAAAPLAPEPEQEVEVEEAEAEPRGAVDKRVRGSIAGVLRAVASAFVGAASRAWDQATRLSLPRVPALHRDPGTAHPGYGPLVPAGGRRDAQAEETLEVLADLEERFAGLAATRAHGFANQAAQSGSDKAAKLPQTPVATPGAEGDHSLGAAECRPQEKD